MLNQKTPEQIIYCLEIPSGILVAVMEQLTDAHPALSVRDWPRDSTIGEKIKGPALVLFNLDRIIEKNPKQPIFPTPVSKSIRAIGLYSSSAPSPEIFRKIRPIKDLISADEPNKIAFAIDRELQVLALEQELDRTRAQLENSERRISLLTDIDQSTNDVWPAIPKWVLDKAEFTLYLDKHLYLLNQNNHAALALIEVDHYSAIPANEKAAFDSRCMSFVSNILLARCRSLDVLAHFDTNVLALFSTRYTQKSFPTFMENLRLSVTENLFEENSNFFQIKCSVGVCFWSEHVANTSELIARAQQACATASIGDGNLVHVYQTLTTPFDVLEELPEYEEQIKSALRENRFRLVYQPIVNLNFAGEENYAILIRMVDKKGQHLSPDRFIPIAENTGLIDYIDQWVVQQSVELAKRSQKNERSRSYFLKISGYSIKNDKIVKCLYYYLKKARVNGNTLVFQIDYVEFINHPQNVISFIEQIKKAGCRIAFDHFGFGEYSEDQLKDLGIDFIKIDGSFTRNMLNQPSHQKTIKHIQETAQNCNVKTIAKSVENANALAMLWNIGVDAVQGYFIQEPNESMRFDFKG